MIEILTPEEVAELLRISPNRVMLLVKRGEIAYLNIDGRIRFEGKDVEEWLRFQRTERVIKADNR